MNFIKGAILVIFITVFSVGCSKQSGGNSIEDKKKNLESLKSQKTELEKQIAQLEKELEGVGGAKNQVVVNVETIDIAPSEFNRFVDVQGSVSSDKTVQVSCKSPGQVVNILAQAGQQVNKGALIIQIDDEPYRKGLEEIETQFEFAKTVYLKQQRLWDQKAGSEIQYLQAKNNVEALEKRIASLKSQIENSKIYAPFAGFIDEIIPKLGETVAPGYPVVRITAMSDVKVLADISETYASTIKEGDLAQITFNELNETISGKVSMATKTINPVNRSFRVELKLSKTPKSLKPNMACGVPINDVKKKEALIVPISCVQRQEGKEFVYVAVDENGLKAKQRFIKTGLANQDNIEITEGLAIGDKVISAGSLDVSDGQPISVKSK